MIKMLVNGSVDATECVRSATWAGDMNDVSRTLNVEMLPDARAELGDRISFVVDGAEIFSGMVLTTDDDGFTAADAGIYLARNATYKEYNGLPQHIAMQVCAEFGIAAGALHALPGAVKVVSTGNLTAYQVIKQAYEGEERKPVNDYCIRILSGALQVKPKGAEFAGALDVQIADAQRGASIKSMVNRVIILNKAGAVQGTVENADDLQKYGMFSKTYKTQDGKDAVVEAKKDLEKAERTAKVTALADSALFIAGNAAEVYHAETGLSGRFVIKSDSHTFDGMTHTMNLELEVPEG